MRENIIMTAAVDIPALEALLCAAFDGDPGAGRRELRLSQEEAAFLHTAYPAARLSLLEQDGEDGKAWYALGLSQGPAPDQIVT
jgi:hypothetical protein